MNIKYCSRVRLPSRNTGMPVLAQHGESCIEEVLNPEETALVLVDYWDWGDTSPGGYTSRTLSFLEQLKSAATHIIHAPGEAALGHKEYKALRSEVKAFLGDSYCQQRRDTDNRGIIYEYQQQSDHCPENATNSFKMSPFIKPDSENPREYLLAYEDEFRYVLWKNKIKNILYVGGALDECMSYRPYGFNGLKRYDFNIYVVSDLTSIMNASVDIVDNETEKTILLNSLSGSNTLKVIETTDIEISRAD